MNATLSIGSPSFLLELEEIPVRVGTVNCYMTRRARLILHRLVMERGNTRGCRVDRQRVTFKAEQVHLTALQQTRIRRSVWGVTDHATFRLHGSMFEDERACLVCMAAKANLILGRGRAKLTREESAVRIVTIAAGHQTFVYSMVHWFGKLRLDFGMAVVAEHGLR